MCWCTSRRRPGARAWRWSEGPRAPRFCGAATAPGAAALALEGGKPDRVPRSRLADRIRAKNLKAVNPSGTKLTDLAASWFTAAQYR
jgi:hypothetical protein